MCIYVKGLTSCVQKQADDDSELGNNKKDAR